MELVGSSIHKARTMYSACSLEHFDRRPRTQTHTHKMDAEAFRKHGKEMVDYVADYLEGIKDRRPLSNVDPGYLCKLIPEQAPEDPEKWEDVFGDIERVIMPGVSAVILSRSH